MKLHNRSIKAEYFTDFEFREKVSDCLTRELFIGLWMLADDSGCLFNSPRDIKYLLYPTEPKITISVIQKSLNLLEECGCIIAYAAEGKSCLYIRSFSKHQTLFNPGRSEVPLPVWISFIPSESGKRTGRYETNINLITTSEQVDNNLYSRNGTEGTSSSSSGSLEGGAGETKPTDKTNNGEKSVEERFEQFWQHYPKKGRVAKALCLEKFKKALTKATFFQIGDGLDRHLKCDQWLKEDGAFVPNMATWLYQQRWNDEPLTTGRYE